MMEVLMGNCKTVGAHAKVNQVIWFLALAESQSLHFKPYRKVLPMHLFFFSGEQMVSSNS